MRVKINRIYCHYVKGYCVLEVTAVCQYTQGHFDIFRLLYLFIIFFCHIFRYWRGSEMTSCCLSPRICVLTITFISFVNMYFITQSVYYYQFIFSVMHAWEMSFICHLIPCIFVNIYLYTETKHILLFFWYLNFTKCLDFSAP